MDLSPEVPTGINTPVLLRPPNPVEIAPVTAYTGLTPSDSVDFDRILSSPHARRLVHSLTPQQLLTAVSIRGVADSLELLELVSKAQVTRLFDYVAWQQGRLDLRSLFGWLAAFKEIDRSQYFDRFAALEEEYQLAALGPVIDLIDQDQYEALSSDQQDHWSPLPCLTLYFAIKGQDQELRCAIEELITIGLERDLNYTYMLLAHAAFLPPNEAEADLQQFRRARLEEDGFVDRDESFAALLPMKIFELQSLTKLYSSVKAAADSFTPNGEGQASSQISEMSLKEEGGRTFFHQVLQWITQNPSKGNLADDYGDQRPADQGESKTGAINSDMSAATPSNLSTSQLIQQIQKSFIHLVNGFCAALEVEPDDTGGQQQLMMQAEGLISLGLEFLGQGNPEVAAKLLREQHLKVILRTALTLVEEVRGQVRDGFEAMHHLKVPGLGRHLVTRRLAPIRRSIDRLLGEDLGFERSELLKALFETIPQVAYDSLPEDSRKPDSNGKSRRRLESLEDLQLVQGGVNATLWLARLGDQFLDSCKPNRVGDPSGSCLVERAFTTVLVSGILFGKTDTLAEDTIAEPNRQLSSIRKVKWSDLRALQSWTDIQFATRLEATLKILNEKLDSDKYLQNWTSSQSESFKKQVRRTSATYLTGLARESLLSLRTALQFNEVMPSSNELERLVLIAKDD